MIRRSWSRKGAMAPPAARAPAQGGDGGAAGAADRGGQHRLADHAAVMEHGDLADGVLELADIAGPAIGEEAALAPRRRSR